MKQSSSIYFNMGGLFYEGKSNITIIAAGLWSDRTFSSDTGIFALSVLNLEEGRRR